MVLDCAACADLTHLHLAPAMRTPSRHVRARVAQFEMGKRRSASTHGRPVAVRACWFAGISTAELSDSSSRVTGA